MIAHIIFDIQLKPFHIHHFQSSPLQIDRPAHMHWHLLETELLKDGPIGNNPFLDNLQLKKCNKKL